MTVFTIDLWFGYSIKPDRRAVQYVIRMGALKACAIAESLGDGSPTRIIVRDHGWGCNGKSVVRAEFTATECDEIDAAISSISSRLGTEIQLRKAILRVPRRRSKDLPRDAIDGARRPARR